MLGPSVSDGKEYASKAGAPSSISGSRSYAGEGIAYPPSILGLPLWLTGKESACNVGDLRLILGFRRSPGGGHGNPLQYSCPENPHGQRSLAGYSPRVGHDRATEQSIGIQK